MHARNDDFENNGINCVRTIRATPTVAENEAALNAPVLYCTRKDVFPTPESPSRMVYGSDRIELNYAIFDYSPWSKWLEFSTQIKIILYKIVYFIKKTKKSLPTHNKHHKVCIFRFTQVSWNQNKKIMLNKFPRPREYRSIHFRLREVLRYTIINLHFAICKPLGIIIIIIY